MSTTKPVFEWLGAADGEELSTIWCQRIGAAAKLRHNQPSNIRTDVWQPLRNGANLQMVAGTPAWRSSMPALFGQAGKQEMVAVFVDNKSQRLLPVAEDTMSLLQWAVTCMQLEHLAQLQSGDVFVPMPYNQLMERVRRVLEKKLHVSTDGRHRGISCRMSLPKFVEANPGLNSSSDSTIGGRKKWGEEVCHFHLACHRALAVGLQLPC